MIDFLLILCLILLLGQADQIREEHTQSTHRATFSALPVPLPRQVHVELFFGVFFEVEKSVEKVVPKGAQMDTKSGPKSIQRVFRRGLERDLKMGPSPGQGKIRFCYYLLHFSKVGGLKTNTFLGTILGPFGRQNH